MVVLFLVFCSLIVGEFKFEGWWWDKWDERKGVGSLGFGVDIFGFCCVERCFLGFFLEDVKVVVCF